MLKYLARLGWSHDDQEVFTGQRIVERCDFKVVDKSACAFNSTSKIRILRERWLQCDGLS